LLRDEGEIELARVAQTEKQFFEFRELTKIADTFPDAPKCRKSL
jgi:hypothetical protein